MNNDSIPARPVYLFDRLFIGYSSLMALLILLGGRPIGDYVDELLFYLGMIALSILIIRYIDESKSRLSALVRILYPVFLFTFFYRTTGGMMLMISDHFLDSYITQLEQLVLGNDLSILVDLCCSDMIWANELFSFGYFSYYLMLPGFLLYAFFRRDDFILKSSVSTMCLAFYVSYLMFVLLPVESPRWYLADLYINTIEGPVFRPLVDLVIGNAGLRGGGMPSSHVAVALVILIYCLRFYPRAGRILIPINILLAAGTVWGRFHYLSDVVAGILVGLVSVLIIRKYFEPSMRWRN